MESSDETWFIIVCNSDFIVNNLLDINNLKLNLKIGDNFAKIVSIDGLSNFLNFSLELKNGNESFGNKISVSEEDYSSTILDLGGIEYINNSYIIFAFSNYLGFYEHILPSHDEHIKYLKNKMKLSCVPPSNYEKLAVLNNEIINMQRELFKSNSYITELLKYKEEMNKNLGMLNTTKDRIFSIIGHDLRSPLANIIDTLKLLDSGDLSYEDLIHEHFFKDLGDTVNGSMLLLDNLLEWSKCQLGELAFYPSSFNLNETIQGVLTLLNKVAIDKNISFLKDFGENLMVYGDQRTISVILRNLISNALKFTNENGQIKIIITRDKEFVKIHISDNGIGMLQTKIDTLFDMNTDNVINGTKGEKGTGFGLILCRDLIFQNGGTFDITSQIGVGSEFIFTIPLFKSSCCNKVY